MTSRITDSLTGVGLAALLAVVGVGTERIYGEPDADVRTIATLEQRVSRLESIVADGGIHIEGGKAEVHVTVPHAETLQQQEDRRIRDILTAQGYLPHDMRRDYSGDRREERAAN